MEIIKFTSEELKLLHDLLSEIIDNSRDPLNLDYPDDSHINVLKFSKIEFYCLHRIRTVISEFLE